MPEGDGKAAGYTDIAVTAPSQHTGIAVDPGPGLGFGQLNPVHKKIIQVD